MSTIFTYRVNRNSAYFALLIFVVSTLMFLLYTATEAKFLTSLGILLLVILVILSPITLAILIVNALVNIKDLRQHVLALFMMLVSISMTILYIKLISDF